MAAKIFSPLMTRLRRRAQEERLLENDESFLLKENDFCEVHDNCLSKETTTESRTEANGVSARTAKNYALELQDDLVLSRDENTTAVATRIKNPSRKAFAFPRHILGIILAITSSFLLSFSSLMIKLAESIPTLEVTFMRLTFHLVFSLPAMVLFKDKFIYPWKQSKYLLLRGVTGATSMSLMIYSVKHMPLADARVIFYIYPVCTALLGRIFLKEPVSKFDVIAMVLSIGGVVLIGRPSFLFGSVGKTSGSGEVWVPTLTAVAAAVLAALSAVLTRKMSQEVGPRVVVFYFALVGSIITFAGSLISGFKYPDCGTHDPIYMIGAGTIGFFGQILTSKALSLEKASVVSLVRTIGIVFSFILQLIVLDVIPNGLSIGGASLVLLCNVTIFIKKCQEGKKSQTQSRN